MIVYTVLVWLAVVGSGLALQRSLARARGSAGAAGPAGPAVLDGAEVAFLTGGPRRVVDAALVALCYDGRMMIGGPGVVQVRTGARGTDPVERAVLEVFAAAPASALAPLRTALLTHPAVRETGEGLLARGLLADPVALSRVRARAGVQALLCLLALPPAAVLATVDPAPALAALPALVLGLGWAAVLVGLTSGRACRAGRRALEAYRAAYGHLGDPRVAVSLDGARAVPDPLLRTQLLRATTPGAGRTTRHGGGDAEAVAVWCGGASGGSSSSCASSSSCGSSSSCASSSSCGSSSSCASSSSCGSSSSCSSSSSSSCSSSS
ncbi:TIGR04222 domain-containing membrane protein [Streptomyces sp. NPDC012888]|uniref:TIGR04222 domain-containing membrane protein n=1 Tax=Streptomyces sp. NPDC012888 TaxID=3364855 RepID=UPI0036CD691A